MRWFEHVRGEAHLVEGGLGQHIDRTASVNQDPVYIVVSNPQSYYHCVIMRLVDSFFVKVIS